MIELVSSNYYSELTDNMVSSIETFCEKSNISYNIHKVNGVWEIPYRINSLIGNSNYFIAIGVVIKGETDHYEYISSAVSNGLITLSLNKDVYISNCILNVKNYNQAVERSKTKGVEAIEALLNILNND
tara:strand:+ start:68 stop:454 length:387 start_codon:yes stop_codon:yes gene_type:complete